MLLLAVLLLAPVVLASGGDPQVSVGPHETLYLVYASSASEQCKKDVVALVGQGLAVVASCEGSSVYAWVNASDVGWSVPLSVLASVEPSSFYAWPGPNVFESDGPGLTLFSWYTTSIWGPTLHRKTNLTFSFGSASDCASFYSAATSNCSHVALNCAQSPPQLQYLSESGGCSVPLFKEWPKTFDAASLTYVHISDDTKKGGLPSIK